MAKKMIDSAAMIDNLMNGRDARVVSRIKHPRVHFETRKAKRKMQKASRKANRK